MEIIPPYWKLKNPNAKLEICETSPPNIKLFMCMMHTMNEAYNFVVTMAYVWVPCTTPINIGIIQQTRIPKLLTIKWCIIIFSENASKKYKYVSPHPTRECNDTPTNRSMWTNPMAQISATVQRVKASIQICGLHP